MSPSSSGRSTGKQPESRGGAPHIGDCRPDDPAVVASVGAEAYPPATELLITADDGGSNGSRVQLWKVEIQKLADEIGFPSRFVLILPGTSKLNKIEHCLFSFISMNWRGQPLVNHKMTLKLIAGPDEVGTDGPGRAELDPGNYPKRIKVSDEGLASLHLVRHFFHGEWNYSLHPR